ncbi:MAG: hypothetical protein FJ026_08500, partial [Chloroflexi bacterium]|nr:hypothetical protein [Chloroflexota bacterium]
SLLRCQLRIMRNAWRPDSRGRSHLFAALLVVPLFMFMLFAFSVYFLSYSGLVRASSPIAQPAVPENTVEMLSISSTTIFLVISLGALQQAFETFYLAPDTSLLLASPISRRAILTVKLLANMRWDALMVFMTAVPIWVAFGVWLHVPPIFYPLLFVGWLLLLILVSGLSVALTMLLVRIVPAPRLRQVVLSFLFGIILLVVVLFQGIVSGAWSREGVLSILERGLLTRQIWLPSVWLSRGLLAFVLGHPGEGWPWLALLALGTILAALLAYAAGAQLYARGWVGALNTESGAARRRRAQAWSRPTSPTLAVMRKDLRLFSRQPIEWYRAALGLVAMATALAVFTAEERQASRALVLSLAMGFVGASTFAVNLSLRGVSKESFNWWILQASPLTEGGILWAKLLTAFVPTAFYACLAMVGMQLLLRSPLVVLPLSIPVMLAMVAGLTALDLAIGIWRADFRQAAETRNADIVSVLVSQAANYFLLTPALIMPSLSALWANPNKQVELLRTLLAEAVLLIPLNALVVLCARGYSLRKIRALRLSEAARPTRPPRRKGRRT